MNNGLLLFSALNLSFRARGYLGIGRGLSVSWKDSAQEQRGREGADPEIPGWASGPPATALPKEQLLFFH